MAAKAFKILGCACLQLFISGWVYSFGIFTPYLQQASPSGNNLQEAWITGIGMIGLLSIPSMIIAGIIMSGESGTLDNHNVENSYSKTRQIRLTSLTGSFCYAMLSVAGWSIVADSSFLMYCSYFFIANGMGIYYLIALELLAAWFPERSGLAVGIGQMCFGIGSIVSAFVFDSLVKASGVVNALYISGALMCLPLALTSSLLEWPIQQHRDEEYPEEAYANEYSPLSERVNAKTLSPKKLLLTPQFWIFTLTFMCAQGGFVMVPYFFTIGLSFHATMEKLVQCFQVINIVSLAARLLAGSIVDHLKSDTGFFRMGTKNTMLLLLSIQFLSFLSLIISSSAGWFPGFAIFVGLIVVTFGAMSCCVSLLAREQFGSANSSIVFGMGGSISMGTGEIVSVMLMRELQRDTSTDVRPSSFSIPYFALACITFLGIICCLFLKRWEVGQERKERIDVVMES